jgi:hypothetical protein
MDRIFDKTDKGREKIATRKYRLAPRLCTLLLLIDENKALGNAAKKSPGEQQARSAFAAGAII